MLTLQNFYKELAETPKLRVVEKKLYREINAQTSDSAPWLSYPAVPQPPIPPTTAPFAVVPAVPIPAAVLKAIPAVLAPAPAPVLAPAPAVVIKSVIEQLKDMKARPDEATRKKIGDSLGVKEISDDTNEFNGTISKDGSIKFRGNSLSIEETATGPRIVVNGGKKYKATDELLSIIFAYNAIDATDLERLWRNTTPDEKKIFARMLIDYPMRIRKSIPLYLCRKQPAQGTRSNISMSTESRSRPNPLIIIRINLASSAQEFFVRKRL